jgi:hypothetical protein
MPPPPVLLWFRRDLRLDDNAALDAAIATGWILALRLLGRAGFRPEGGSRPARITAQVLPFYLLPVVLKLGSIALVCNFTNNASEPAHMRAAPAA